MMEMVLGDQLELHLLQGCCLEGERADLVALQLQGLHNVLPDGNHAHLMMTIEEIRASSQLLFELPEHCKVHFSRVPIVLDYLEILLPCLSRSLRDITTFYEDRSQTRENRWRKMYHSMTDEAGGLSLPQRFILYNRFLTLLRELLTRSLSFDFNTMETTRVQLMELREARNIPPPPIRLNSTSQLDSVLDDDSSTIANIHWSEKIFSLPLPSRTPLKHQQPSKAWGPLVPWEQIQMPSDAKILFMRSFNERQITLVVYESARDNCPYFLLRTFHMGTPWFSLRGAHELVVDRNGSCLQFWRWSESDRCTKRWATLCFLTWEEMVLVYCCFLSFKTRDSQTLRMAANEDLSLWGERKLFQARIVDDNFMHSLIVYEDFVSKGLRLHAAVWEGDLRQCPVWTAFVTHQSASSRWIKRVSKTRVRLADIHLYVFCQEYRQQNQRINRSGAFEIKFVSEEAAKRFRDIFAPSFTDESTTTDTTA